MQIIEVFERISESPCPTEYNSSFSQHKELVEKQKPFLFTLWNGSGDGLIVKQKNKFSQAGIE